MRPASLLMGAAPVRALVLDPVAAANAGAIGRVEGLDDDAFEPEGGADGEDVGRVFDVARAGLPRRTREVERLQVEAPLFVRRLDEGRAVEPEDVEGEERQRRPTTSRRVARLAW